MWCSILFHPLFFSHYWEINDEKKGNAGILLGFIFVFLKGGYVASLTFFVVFWAIWMFLIKRLRQETLYWIKCGLAK